MGERIYCARAINTYADVGAQVGDEYVAFLLRVFPGATIVDPGDKNSEVARRADELTEQHMIDPSTGERSEEYYNKHGSKFVMEYLLNEVVSPCSIGVGLMTPTATNNNKGFVINAGIAAEIKKISNLGRRAYLVSCERAHDGELRFRMECIARIEIDEDHEVDEVSKRPLLVFYTEEGGVYRTLSVNETRSRVYTPRPDGTWDRNKLQPYFQYDLK